MNIKFIILSIFLLTLWFSCEKDLNITDFKDDFGNYESELKIEGILQLDSPKKSIVRIIKSSPVTDTDIFNGKDDDGDSEIDEYDEILPLIQDTSATVMVRNLNTEEAWDFKYVAEADSFYWNFEEQGGPPTNTSDEFTELVKYGGYKPSDPNFHLESYTEYQLEVYSKDFDQTITGKTILYPKVEFLDTLFSIEDSIMTMNVADDKEIFWQSDAAVTAYYVSYDEIYEVDEGIYESDFLFSYKSTINQEATKNYNGLSIGKETLWGVNNPVIFKLTVQAMSPEYGKYMFSSLPLNDPNKTNLEDSNGNPVMGCFGGAASNHIYIVVEE